MDKMFYRSRIPDIDVSNFDVRKVKKAFEMFAGCKADTINLCGSDFADLSDARLMFMYSVVNTLNLSNCTLNPKADVLQFADGLKAQDIIVDNTRLNKIITLTRMGVKLC